MQQKYGSKNDVKLCNPYASDPIIVTYPRVLTPDSASNLYSIGGCYFGGSGSNAKAWVYGPGFKRDLELRFWTDNAIVVALDANITGIGDEGNLKLVVQRQDGKQVQVSGIVFYAARDTIQLNSVPGSWVNLGQPSPNNYESPSKTLYSHGLTVALYRQIRAKLTPASDYYDLSGLPPGWVVDKLDWMQYDALCPGVVTYKQDFGSWGPQWDPGTGNFHFQWGDTTCSGWTPSPFPWIGWYSNITSSEYSLRIWVRGPRGTRPSLH
ncbi:MAG: hypothetical protein DLM53_01175 [Candidatus Eremiobacter antarcticus]|nr:MAG: hypothetical protein DLM53_01175 [Candidatus Eremiobacter sp. RRmetagenome_bin22]